jgi:hypothetical protein
LRLLTLGLFGTDWVTVPGLEKWAALLTILVLAASYMLGVVVDRIADNIWRAAYRFAERQDWRRRKRKRPATVERLLRERPTATAERLLREMRFAVMHESEGLGTFLDYQRSRLRVARATTINAVLTVPIAANYLATQSDVSVKVAVSLGCIAAVLILASAYSAIAINGAWEESVEDAYTAVEGTRHPDASTDEAPSA